MALLVGIIDEAIPQSTNVNWDVNKIGGNSVWMSQAPQDVKCNHCQQQLTLCLQLYCPMGGSPFHRCLYIFTCIFQSCTETKKWKVFRDLLFDGSYNDVMNVEDCTAGDNLMNDEWSCDQDDWGASAEDWGDDDSQDFGTTSTGDNDGAMGAFVHLDEDQSCVGPGSVHRDIADNGTLNESKESIDSNLNFTKTVTPVGDVEPVSSLSKMTLSDNLDMQDTCGAEQQGNANSFSNDGCSGDSTVPLENSQRWEAMACLLNTKHKTEVLSNTNASTDKQETFKAYYLCVIAEPEENFHEESHVTELIKEYERSEGKQLTSLICEGARPKGQKGTELYEKSELRHGDKAFHKFCQRLQRCPEQCVRYDRCGHPLLVKCLTEQEEESFKACKRCGGPLVFELQLMPALIPWLTTQDGSALPIDYSTVLVFTCQSNCQNPDSGPVEELTLVQQDPDQHLYR